MKDCRAKSQRMHFLTVLANRVRWPLATVRVAPLYQVCGRVAYLCVAFPCQIAKVCDKFVNFERIFLYEPCFKIRRNGRRYQHVLALCALLTGVILCLMIVYVCFMFTK